MSNQHPSSETNSTVNDPPDPLETWGKTFNTAKPPNVYRFIFQNVNNLSANQSCDTTTTSNKLAGIKSLDPDCIMIAEAGINWGNTRQLRATRKTFFDILGEGSLQTAHNTYSTHSSLISGNALNSIPGGVCHWMNKSLTGRVVHHHSDHLGRFTIALLIGPRNQGMAVITAYRPVESGNKDTAVANQHRQILGTESTPREACLKALLEQIMSLQHQGYSVLLGMDANENTSDELFPSEGLNHFLQQSGLVDPIEHFHGRCPFPTSSARSGSPIDFFFCSEDLLPFVETGILGEAQGACSDHRCLAIDMDLHSMWDSSEEQTQEPRPRGFRSDNIPKSLEFVNTLHESLSAQNIFKTVGKILERIKSGVYDAEEEQAKLSAADDIITAEMLKAEDAIRPSRTAASHSWSPELVSLQKKANLLKQAGKYSKDGDSLSESKKRTFTREASMIDPTWNLDLSSAEAIHEASHTATKEARLATKRQKELRRQHLERLIQEKTSLGDEEDRERAIKMIKRIEAQRQTHRTIQAAFKQRAPPITHVVKDGNRLSGKDMNDALVARNQSHFMQPPQNGASVAIHGTVRDDLRTYDDEGRINNQEEAFKNYYSILDGEYDLDKVKESERPFYNNLRRVAPPDENMARDITYADLHHYMKKLPEKTSSSPSGRHVGLYKALHVYIPVEDAAETQKSIATLLLDVINSCLRMGFVLPRWRTGTDITLQKKPGVYDIESMRIIRLLECDLNFMLKIKFAKHAMHSLERRPEGSPLADNQYGFRPKRSTEQAILRNRISLDIAHQTSSIFATLETDCKAAFDCCDPNLVVIAHLRLGIPEILAKLMSNHLNLTKFNVRSEGRTSETLYGGPGLCFGTGQGGGGSPPNWIFLHDVTLKTLEAHPIKSCVIHDPRTGEKKSSNSNAFADDMNFASMDTTQKLSVEQVCSNLQIMGQTANDCIRASGGSFNLAKCSWRCSKPTVIYGKPEVEEIIRDLEIVPTQDSSAVHIPRLSKETPHRQLGVQLVPSLSPSPQLDLLRLKCLKFGSIMRRNTLTNHQSNVVFEHYMAPAIQYPCTTQAIQSKDIDSLQSITLRPLLSKLGISSTFARKALYAPSKYGGANLKCWHLEVLAKQLALLISNLDGDGWLGFILRASTNFTQLEWGKSGHFLESSDTMVASVCTPTWITVIQSNCQKKDIRLPGGWVPPLKRHGDIHIGDLPSEYNINLSAPDTRKYHQVFQYLHITTLSDMVDPSGKILRKSAWDCQKFCKSEYKWPENSFKITPQHKNIWHTVLEQIVCTRTRQLRNPLGQWTGMPNGNFPFFLCVRGLVQIMLSGEWRLYDNEHVSTRPTRSRHRCFASTYTIVDRFQGPKWFTEVYVRDVDGMLITVTANEANLYDDTSPQPPLMNTDSWQDFLSFLKHSTADQPSAFNAIVGNLPIKAASFPVLCDLLRASVDIFASSDGSVRSDLLSASSGWLFWVHLRKIPEHIVTHRDLEVDQRDSPIMILLAGTTLAHGRLSTLSSYRAEGSGALVIVYIMNQLKTFLHLHSPPKVTHNCDNQGLVKQVNRLKASSPAGWWHDVTDADILSEIAHQAREINHVFEWEQGHPERRYKQEHWTPSEWGNHFADGLAAEAWDRTDAMNSSQRFAPKLPHASSLSLHLQDGSLHGNIKRALPPIITAYDGRKQLAKYIHYTEAQLEEVDWELLQLCSQNFTSTALARFHFCKAFNNQWYTEALAKKQSNSLDATCRCCTSSPETIAHVFACSNRTSVHQEHNKAIINIFRSKKLHGSLLRALELGIKVVRSNECTHRGETTWQGDPEGTAIQQEIHRFYSDDNVDNDAKLAFTSQTFLGWEDAFQGRFSQKWKTLSSDKNWARPVLTELMNWGRACWTNRCTHLFGERKDQYRLRRHRLHLQVHIWYESPRTQVLVDRNTFPERASILHRNNEGIARWLDQQHAVRDSRRKRTSQTTGQLTMDRFMGTRASRRDHNLIFQGSLQEARRANLPVINETTTASDGDHSHGGTPPSEEPPD